MKQTIAVFGSSRADEGSPQYREAYDLGAALARAGYRVLSGGYNGSMAAVSRGAAEAGGEVVGVTCGLFDPLPANRWLTEETKAGTLMERLKVMIERSDGFVAVRGGIGTLAEVALVWSLLQTRSIAGKPLVLLGDDWRPLVSALLEHSDLGISIAMLTQIVATPSQALIALNHPPTPPGPPPLG